MVSRNTNEAPGLYLKMLQELRSQAVLKPLPTRGLRFFAAKPRAILRKLLRFAASWLFAAAEQLLDTWGWSVRSITAKERITKARQSKCTKKPEKVICQPSQEFSSQGSFLFFVLSSFVLS